MRKLYTILAFLFLVSSCHNQKMADEASYSLAEMAPEATTSTEQIQDETLPPLEKNRQTKAN